MMTRGASNVQKGSFTALAANQAAWIVSTIRNDVARSDINNINFDGSGNKTWSGDSTFEVVLDGGVASYFLEKKGSNNKVFVRKFKSSTDKTAFNLRDDKVSSFGDEYMTGMTVKLSDDNSYFCIDISMDEPGADGGNKHEFNWSANVFIPQPNAIGKYWVPTVEREAESE